MSTPPHPRANDVRGDIQALRALAVLAVVVYHLWPRHLSGGYVGVNVFFVISGFLITKHLADELATTGSIRLRVFWARRAKRLLPAALLVISTTVVATIAFAPLSRWKGFFNEGLASTFYFENWLLSHNAVDYLTSDDPPSPFQHYWSLSVEEQFYFGLPILMVLSAWFVHRRAPARRRTVVAMLVLVGALSFAYSVWFTTESPTQAYFSTFTQLWNFAIGGLIAFLPEFRGRSRLLRAVAWAAATAVVVSTLIYSDTTPFPGYHALLPVLGAATLIAARTETPLSVERLGRIRWIRFVGDASYAVYLWHWPLVVLWPLHLHRALTSPEKVGVLLATLLLAGLSKKYVEDPVRFSPRALGIARPRKVALVSAVLMGITTSTVAAGHAVFDARVDTGTTSPDGRCFGAPAMFDPACSPLRVTRRLTPDPAVAALDDVAPPECWSGLGVTRLEFCTIAAPDDRPRLRLLAVGDSHNSALWAAYEVVAEQNHWEIDVLGHNGCYWTTAEQTYGPGHAEDDKACNRWSAELVDHLAQAEPYDAIITTYSVLRSIVVARPGETEEETAIAGNVEAWAPELARGTTVIALLDAPVMIGEVVTCVDQHRLRPNTACANEREVALGRFSAFPEAVRLSRGAQLVDLTDALCDEERCYPVIGDVMAYRDSDHVTATFARTMGTLLAERLLAATGRRP